MKKITKSIIYALIILSAFACGDLPRDNKFDPLASNSPGYPDVDFSVNGGSAACLDLQPSVFIIDGSSTADGSGTQYRWYFENDGVWTAWSTSKTVNRTYSAPGNEEVTLEAQNSLGMLKNIKKTVQIVNSQPPVANFVYGPTNPSIGNTVSFDAATSIDDDSLLSEIQVRWDFENDGIYDTPWSVSKTTTHVFNTATSFTVKLDVRDKFGLGGSKTKVITVQAAPTYTVIYNGNGSTGGTEPLEPLSYEQGVTVTVLGNTGTLVKTGSEFGGWNTKADGTGTTYGAGETFLMGKSNVTLWAKWGTFYSVTYNGNGSTGGDVPVDGKGYEQGNTVTVLGNTGTLVKVQDGITCNFLGWNTEPTGSGTSYTQNLTFSIATANVTLYAKWSSVIGATGPGGGLIFYDKGSYSGTPSWRYLEAAPASTEPVGGKQWGSYGTLIGGTGTAVGTGRDNTLVIVAWLASHPEAEERAAQYCDALDYGGKSDWFLPSKDELNYMYTRLKVAGVGGFVDDIYWSSSEYSANNSWMQYFKYGVQSYINFGYADCFKANSWTQFVRAIRAF